MIKQTVKWTFVWSMGIAFIFMGIYHFAGIPMLKVMTSDAAVIEQSREYLPWLLLMPVIGCAAFTWDGIYIGATASKDIRNAMLWATAAFAFVWVAGRLGLDMLDPADAQKGTESYFIISMHILMAAYFAHLLARTLYLSVKYRRTFRFAA